MSLKKTPKAYNLLPVAAHYSVGENIVFAFKIQGFFFFLINLMIHNFITLCTLKSRYGVAKI